MSELVANTLESVRGFAPSFLATLALATRVGVTILVIAMSLQQMGLTGDIINLAFGLVLGAAAVAAASAFEVGRRDIARDRLHGWTSSGGEH